MENMRRGRLVAGIKAVTWRGLVVVDDRLDDVDARRAYDAEVSAMEGVPDERVDR
jgi:hypothetical protein